MVIASLEGWDAQGLKTIASAIVEQPGHVAILISSPPPASIVVARSSDQQVDAGALLKQLVSRFGGKGGGRSELAQEGPGCAGGGSRQRRAFVASGILIR